ncbi:MAG: Eco57I restriction-modification methylase domain-containing protein, partial [Trebonia sp.]
WAVAAMVLYVDLVTELLLRTEERRSSTGMGLDPGRRARLGQFFTPSRAADLIASMPRLPVAGTLRVLDPGAGVGSLTAALTARVLRESPGIGIELVAVEVDDPVCPALEATLADCSAVAAAHGLPFTWTALRGDLTEAGTGLARETGVLAAPFDVVIMNPPYRKLARRSAERLALAGEGVDCSNLYTAFLAVGVNALAAGGQLVAITPRSFANGPYFDEFRRFFLDRMALDRVHVFESRSAVFADADVLQENIVFSATRSGKRGDVALSVSSHHSDEPSTRAVPYASVVEPGDPQQFIRIVAGESDVAASRVFAALPCTLAETGIEVSTGKVVDFRAREYLRDSPGHGTVPLIYPGNLRDGSVAWPLGIRKPQALASCEGTRKLLVPGERYVLVKRFSAKEERRRVVAAVYEGGDFGAGAVGFENHLNVFHCRGRGIGDGHVARGLCMWLNSTVVDKYFRTFSGHTQVNATDLRSLRYPSRGQLAALGAALGGGSWPDQEKLDSLVEIHVLRHNDPS